jgi:phosphatidate cytidylyltransferase
MPTRLLAIDLPPGLRVMLVLLLGLSIASLVVSPLFRIGAKGALRAQVTSWWLLLPPVFAAWALHPFGVPLLVVAISALAVRDLTGLALDDVSKQRLRWQLAGLLFVQAALLSMNLGLWASALMLAWAGIQLHRWRGDRGTRRNALLQALFALQAAGLSCLSGIAAMPSVPPGTAAGWFLYLCVVTALNDIGQFIAGTSFGRHPLAARISPNKTWQGVAGGLLSSVTVSVVAGQTLVLASPLWLAGMGLVLSVAGLLGDLLFSVGKRRLGIKDYSRLIPGHGGILDRVDSLVLTAPAMLAALRLA